MQFALSFLEEQDYERCRVASRSSAGDLRTALLSSPVDGAPSPFNHALSPVQHWRGSEVQRDVTSAGKRQILNLAFHAFLRKKAFLFRFTPSLWRCAWELPLPLNSSPWPFIHLQNASPESQLNYLLSPFCSNTLVGCMKNKARLDICSLPHNGLLSLFPEANGISGLTAPIYMQAYVYVQTDENNVIYCLHLLLSKGKV